jgi:hypothetical protein
LFAKVDFEIYVEFWVGYMLEVANNSLNTFDYDNSFVEQMNGLNINKTKCCWEILVYIYNQNSLINKNSYIYLLDLYQDLL